MSFVRGSVLSVKARFLEGLLADPTVVLLVMNFASRDVALKALLDLPVEFKDSFYFFSSVKYFLSVPGNTWTSLRQLFYPNTLLFLSRATTVSDHVIFLLAVKRISKRLASSSVVPVGIKFLSHVYCSLPFFSRLVSFISKFSSVKQFTLQTAFLAQIFTSLFSLFRSHVGFHFRVVFLIWSRALRSIIASKVV